jgi:molybdenum cofactor cytidylyltransferase
MLTEFQLSGKKIIIPVYRERKGHPIIISSDLFPEIYRTSLSVGLREVVRAHGSEIGFVPTEEKGVTQNIDTPEDYRNHVEWDFGE